eukprot:1156598-Pelagomonas_calceolata.AAC.6
MPHLTSLPGRALPYPGSGSGQHVCAGSCATASGACSFVCVREKKRDREGVGGARDLCYFRFSSFLARTFVFKSGF